MRTAVSEEGKGEHRPGPLGTRRLQTQALGKGLDHSHQGSTLKFDLMLLMKPNVSSSYHAEFHKKKKIINLKKKISDSLHH